MPPQTLEERVSRLEGQLDGVGDRIEQIHRDVQQLEDRIDRRFETLTSDINARFASIDKRFESIDKRFELLTNDFNGRFAIMTQDIHNLRNWVIGFGMIITLLITVFKFLSH